MVSGIGQILNAERVSYFFKIRSLERYLKLNYLLVGANRSSYHSSPQMNPDVLVIYTMFESV